MAEQAFRSPGFFDQEIDLSGAKTSSAGVPAGIIGTSTKGPAFVPVTVGSFSEFESKFGALDSKRFGPYAVQRWLENKTACTYVRVLGAGSNETSADISNTITAGIVANAGFKISGTQATAEPTFKSSNGMVQFICALHNAPANEANGYPVFTDNRSVLNPNAMSFVRGVVFLASGTRLLAINNDGYYSTLAADTFESAKVGAINGSPLADSKYFKLAISSSSGAAWASSESKSGVRIFTASLDPNDSAYIGKVLNTDPLKFADEKHLLYADYAIEHDLAPVVASTDYSNKPTVNITSGTAALSSVSGLSTAAFESLFGRFDTRYITPRTTDFISQPFGKKEYDLFSFETLDDGAYANEKFKVSIAALKASTNDKQPYGTFEVQIRSFDDSDSNASILERYPECSLDPASDRYIAKLIGDKKVYFDFDQEDPDERRLVVTGKYPNVSSRVRIQMNDQVERKQIPKNALPFGFRGVPVLKTTDSLTDDQLAPLSFDGQVLGSLSRRMYSAQAGARAIATTSSIVPPLPLRVKVTRGAVASSPSFLGDPGPNERVDGRFYWGVKFEPIPVDSTTDSVVGIDNAILNANIGAGINPLVRTYTKFQGLQKLDQVVSGTGRDAFNDNKFTLSRVAFGNTASTLSDAASAITGSTQDHMLEVAYVRNGMPNSTTYTVDDGVRSTRITLATLIATSSALFNQFTGYAKFTNIFYGGFDGLNILDEDQFYMRDRATSSDTGGKNTTTAIDGLLTNPAGSGRRNSTVYSYWKAIDIVTNPATSKVNILAIPGIRDSFVTDYAANATKDNGFALYIQDIPSYDKDGTRLYDDSTTRSDVTKTISQFESRAIDNSYVATYFPDVKVPDKQNNRVVTVPSSVAALGALGYTDKTQQAWFAPAGFNRGSLEFVSNVENRLSAGDRDALYDARINPIATFPRTGYVVFGQKTLQVAQTALNRINVRRLLIDIKRKVSNVAKRLTFEQNDSVTRGRLKTSVDELLTTVQAGGGIEKFRVVCDETNNTSAEIEQNKLVARIAVVPTRTIEFISIDFVVTNNGISFV